MFEYSKPLALLPTHLQLSTRVLFGLAMFVGEEDYVISPKNVCVKGYSFTEPEAVFTLGARAWVPGHQHKIELHSDSKYPRDPITI